MDDIDILVCDYCEAKISRLSQIIKIGQFHVRIQECTKVLIAVMSQLDAVVVCINVLYPMEN